MSPKRTESSISRIRLLLCLALVVLSGCATTEFVKLREKPHNPLAERLQSSRFGHLIPSHRTHSFLLASGYKGPDSLQPMLLHCTQRLRSRPDSEALYALAELRYLGARAVAGRDIQLASELYLDAAQAAWYYFSTPDSSGRLPNPTSGSHRAAAELYNTSCESLLRVAKRTSEYRLGGSLLMPLSRRRLQFEIPHPTVLINQGNLSEFEFVTDYKLTNLRNHHRASGLGVPLIARRKPADVTTPIESFYTEEMGFAATAVLRFPSQSFTQDAATTVNSTIRMQLFDPRESDGLLIGDTLLPLETDLSTPLARVLSNPDLKLLDTWGFLRPDHAKSVAGLYMVQPYDPDRIPVLMVHGVWSSPMTWMEMFNDLQADPEIGRRYQFWFYLYPTGEPLPFAAANLREELAKIQQLCNPDHQNSRLSQMVMVGHSMGGLISQVLTIDSGDRLWNSVSRVPVEQVQAAPKEKNEIKRVFFFETNPAISRIITIASPYRGSRYSNAFTRWIGGSLVWLPSPTLQLTRLVTEHNQPGWWNRFMAPRTSLDSLTNKSAILQLIRETKLPDDVHHHNIVGIKSGKSPTDWSDGVVKFASAHLEDIDSEITVKAGHSDIQRHPDTIAEVRRVLIEHLHESQRRRFPVIPVQHSETRFDSARFLQQPATLAP